MTTLLNVRVDEKLKKQAQILAQHMGINLSALVSGLLNKAVKERKVEFVAHFTENGFTQEFEDQVLKSLQEKNGETVCETDEELANFFQNVRKS